ncbi:hypothetical protein C7M84_010959 [Penaeus vannamei]|uniref:Uncharacterized protein n=1 Tax=Penaeus vannamei TaxID=6689 RepID=A0A3R7M3A7_PENVA|nr:hypothetical protein C7M84_010959 [Penaeus vannamei]
MTDARACSKRQQNTKNPTSGEATPLFLHKPYTSVFDPLLFFGEGDPIPFSRGRDSTKRFRPRSAPPREIGIWCRRGLISQSTHPVPRGEGYRDQASAEHGSGGGLKAKTENLVHSFLSPTPFISLNPLFLTPSISLSLLSLTPSISLSLLSPSFLHLLSPTPSISLSLLSLTPSISLSLFSPTPSISLPLLSPSFLHLSVSPFSHSLHLSPFSHSLHLSISPFSPFPPSLYLYFLPLSPYLYLSFLPLSSISLSPSCISQVQYPITVHSSICPAVAHSRHIALACAIVPPCCSKPNETPLTVAEGLRGCKCLFCGCVRCSRRVSNQRCVCVYSEWYLVSFTLVVSCGIFWPFVRVGRGKRRGSWGSKRRHEASKESSSTMLRKFEAPEFVTSRACVRRVCVSSGEVYQASVSGMSQVSVSGSSIR